MRPQQIGQMTVHKIHEMDSGVPMLDALPGITKSDLAQLSRWYREDEITNDPETSEMIFGVHSWLLQIDGLNILVDTCDGNHKQRSLEPVHMLNTDYLKGFDKIGVAPEQIDMVMCTHLHFDHVGWNTRLDNGRWVPTFPNARYLFGKRDYDHFRDNETEGIHYEAYLDSVLPIVEAGLADIIDEKAVIHREIADGVWLEPAFGHSPGSFLINAQRGGAPALFWGDALHHPVQFIRPDLGFFFDTDPAEASRTRQAILDRAADTDTICFPAHFRKSGAGQVLRDGKHFRFDFVT